MPTQTPDQLAQKKCQACEGGVAPYSLEESKAQLAALDGWRLTPDNKRIRREWTLKNFMAAIDFFNRIASLAEADGHHPDLHVESYRKTAVELWTHAIGGLSENDFILAAKIDRLPVELKG